MQGLFVSFEGIDQCGKNTQIRLLTEWLGSMSVKHVVGREPGQTSYGEAARRLLQDTHFIGRLNNAYRGVEGAQTLDPTEHLSWRGELFGYLLSRSQFTEHIIIPALSRGAVFIADRCGDSSIAYQGYGLGGGDPAIVDFIRRANLFALGEATINRTYLLDISAKERKNRKKEGMEFGNHKDRIELRGDEFYERARKGYLAIAKEEPQRWMVIDGTQDRQRISESIIADIRSLLTERGLLGQSLLKE